MGAIDTSPRRVTSALACLNSSVAGHTSDVLAARYGHRIATLFSWLVFVGGTAVLVLFAEPPGVIVAIIAVVVVGILLACVLPRSAHSRSTRPVWLARPPVGPPAPDAPS